MFKLPKLVIEKPISQIHNIMDIVFYEIIYLYLFLAYSPKAIDRIIHSAKNPIGQNSDAQQALTSLGLTEEHRGLFNGTTINEALAILKTNGNKGYKEIETAINAFLSFHFPLFTGSGYILHKQVGKSQYSDGVRINQSHLPIFNNPKSPTYVERGAVRNIYLMLNEKIFPATYRYEGQSDESRHMERIGFNRALNLEFEKLYPNHLGIYTLEMGKDDCHFTIRTQQEMSIEEVSDVSKMIVNDELPQDSARREKNLLESLNKSEDDSTSPTTAVHSVKRYESNPVLKEKVKQLYRYTCQICGTRIKKLGWKVDLPLDEEMKYLVADAHHIIPLSQGGKDVASNIICVWPNCHRRLHTGEYLLIYDEENLVCRNSVTKQYKPFQIKHHIIISGQ
jgi:predicted HNH restriction endonuclease